MSSSSDHCHCERAILFQFPFLQRVRSMKSVSFAMCNVASWKAGVFPDTWNPVKKILDSWLLMPLRERLPPSQLMAIKEVDLDMSCFLPSSYPLPQRFANKCNDTVVLRLPGQMSPTVAMTKFLFDWCEGLIHPRSFAKELPVLFATTERLDYFPNWKFITFIQQICWTRIQGFLMQVSTSDHREPVRLWDNHRNCLLRNVDGWRILSLANTSGCWLGRNLVADAVWLLPCKASGLRREWAKQGARLTFTTEFQIFAKLQEAFLLPACEWELLGSSRWGLQQQPFGRCCTAKSKQHLRHKQRMMIHPEWNQRSLSYGAIL